MCGDGPGRSTWGWAPGAEQTYTPLLDAGPLVGKWPNTARSISGGKGDGQLPPIFVRLGEFAKSPAADARGAAAAEQRTVTGWSYTRSALPDEKLLRVTVARLSDGKPCFCKIPTLILSPTHILSLLQRVTFCGFANGRLCVICWKPKDSRCEYDGLYR